MEETSSPPAERSTLREICELAVFVIAVYACLGLLAYGAMRITEAMARERAAREELYLRP